MKASDEAHGKIGVCILTFNSEKVILSCLQAAFSALRNLPHEIVVVDNNSTDCCVAVLRREHPEIKVIVKAKNLGYSRGNNVGAKYLMERCQFLAFVNPDVLLCKDTLTRMKDALIENSTAGCVGGLAITDGSTFVGCFRNRPTFLEKVVVPGALRYLPIAGALLQPLVRRLEALTYVPPDSVVRGQRVYAVSGACIMFSTAAFISIDGFDENTFLFQEEFIISERLRHHGYDVIAAPDAVYRHILGDSRRSLPSRQSFRIFIESEQHCVRNYFKWGKIKIVTLLAIRHFEVAATACVALLSHFMKQFGIARILRKKKAMSQA